MAARRIASRAAPTTRLWRARWSRTRSFSGIRHDLFHPEGIELFVKKLHASYGNGNERSADPTAAQQQLTKVEREIANIMTAIKAGIITSSTKTAWNRQKPSGRASWQPRHPTPRPWDKLTAFLPNATARYHALVDGLAALPHRHVGTRGRIQDIGGRDFLCGRHRLGISKRN